MNTHSIVRVLGAMALVATPLAAVRGQDVDARWRAWTGCWTPVATTSSVASKAGTVCVVPAAGNSAVDIVSVSGSEVVDRTRIEADGQPHAVNRDGCSGTETARWSSSGTRLYLSESMLCNGSVERRMSGLMSFDQRYQWLDVRGVSSGQSQGVAVTRYDALMDSTGLPAEVMPAFRLRGPAANTAILAAAAPLTLGDIVDVSARTDSGVTATWLMERTRGVQLSLNGKQLTMLADEGVPSSVIDALVAISYPLNFALSGSADAVERPVVASSRTEGTYRGYTGYGGYPAYWYDPYFGPYSYYYDPYYYGYRFGYGGYYGYGYYSPYYGSYYPGVPVVVVNTPSDANAGSAPHGRVVKGRGYTSGSSSSGSSSSTRSSPSGGSSSAASSGSSSSGSASSGGSSSAPRTAVRKPPL
ncbi:MAG: hypothetical protein U9Q74_00825 [Gemmatimonadota bacterium]|nr:hypothetical protein [Gemmatimonadota bacterium]